jgi:cysteine desulfurase/selenocysteine lyase
MASKASITKRGIDVESIKKDFPILGTSMNGKRLVYLDSAATSQKPIQVIDAISNYYKTFNANIHRGIYKISEQATEEYTASKVKLAKFIGAKSYQEIVYVRNTTEAINLAALSWGGANIKNGDHILITQMEHHSNIVPWQMLAQRTGAVLDYVMLNEDKSAIDESSLEEQLSKNPKIFAVSHASNVLGTINDVKKITRMTHEYGGIVLVDGAQSAPHMPVNVSEIGCDFFALSGHKMLGPTGIGALYGKRELLDSMEPIFGGGDMIRSVGFQDHTWNELPWKFEAGTSNIEGGIGMSAAIDYLNGIGMESIRKHEMELTRYAMEKLGSIAGLKVYGPDAKHIKNRGGVISFSIKGAHPHDVAQIFDENGIAIRAGHHCAMPLVEDVLGVGAVSRMSFYIYNDEKDVDAAVKAIGEVKRIFKLN